jgi:hypothetical protein
MPFTSKWATARGTADQLQISERTLYRWRQSKILKAGIHFRRKFPAANSPILYNLELCEQAMTEAFARDPRTLELSADAPHANGNLG